jgi:hypothetical protein
MMAVLKTYGKLCCVVLRHAIGRTWLVGSLRALHSAMRHCASTMFLRHCVAVAPVVLRAVASCVVVVVVGVAVAHGPWDARGPKKASAGPVKKDQN